MSRCQATRETEGPYLCFRNAANPFGVGCSFQWLGIDWSNPLQVKEEKVKQPERQPIVSKYYFSVTMFVQYMYMCLSI